MECYMKGFSDRSFYDLENFAWDEVAWTDDHIVPHQAGEQMNEYITPDDAHKKRKRGIENPVQSTDGTGTATKSALRNKEGNHFYSQLKGEMYATPKDSSTHASDIVIPTSFEAITSESASAPHGSRRSDECLRDCIDDRDSNVSLENLITGSVISLDGSKSFHLSVNDSLLAVADLDFWKNEREDREIEHIYDDLPDCGYFEGVNGMLRNCDATFKEEHMSIADELSWFPSSSNTVYDSEVTLQTGLRSEFPELCEMNNKSGHHSGNDFPKCDQSMSIHDNPSSSLYQSLADWLDIEAEYKDKGEVNDLIDGSKVPSITGIIGGSVLNACQDAEMINLHLKKVKHQCSSEETQYENKKFLSCATSQTYCSQNSLKQEHLMGFSSSSCTHTSNLHPQLDRCRAMHQVLSPQVTSSTTFDKITTFSLKSSDSIVDNASHYMDTLPDQMSKILNTRPNKKLKQVRNKDELCTTMISEDRHQQDYVKRIQKNHHEYSQKIGASHKLKSIPLEHAVDIDSSLVLESSCLPSVSSDDVSIEAISFQQLQDVMDQMDIRTNLCIRDSLYRLARSAEERFDFSDVNSCRRETEDKGGLHHLHGIKSPKRCAGFGDVEGVTNAIDRSIARLLFTGLLHPASRPVL